MKSELEFRSRKAQIWLKVLLSSLTLPFDLWPWLFAWTSLLSMIITSENFMMIRWHKQRKSCDGQTDGWTEPFIELLGRSLKKQGQSEGFDSCDRPSNINQQGSTLSFLAGCPKSRFLGWYSNFLVYWYLKLDNQVVSSTCLKDKLGWIWRADDP